MKITLMTLLTIEMIENDEVPEVRNILTPLQKNTLADYFLKEQFEDITPYFKPNQNYAELAWGIGPEEFENETLQHIVAVLHPDIYEPFM